MESNKDWREAISETFEIALDTGDYALCKDIISDAQEVDLELGQLMNLQLRNMPLEHFLVKSPFSNE